MRLLSFNASTCSKLSPELSLGPDDDDEMKSAENFHERGRIAKFNLYNY
jgi:hypothetical protein